MTERKTYRPFTGDSARSVPLSNAPLALVLCQVRWPQLNARADDFEARAMDIGAKLPDYPLSDTTGVAVVTDPMRRPTFEPLFRWFDADRTWFVSLGRTFVTLATQHYDGFTTFSGRLASVLDSVSTVIAPPLIDRVGLRYVNVMTSAEHDIDKLVRSELVGYRSLRPASNDVRSVQAMTDVRYEVAEQQLQARTGILPSGTQIDPIVPPLTDESWVLDIDAFREGEERLSTELVQSRVSVLADISYDFFRWVVREEFMAERAIHLGA